MHVNTLFTRVQPNPELRPQGCSWHLVRAFAAALHDDKGDEADVTDDTNAEVIAKRLADLDTVADAEVRHLAGLDCAATRTTSGAGLHACCMHGCMLASTTDFEHPARHACRRVALRQAPYLLAQQCTHDACMAPGTRAASHPAESFS